ncbi:hypothetical protein TNCV_2952131 [Trichonephila clavipes]|nr:hypothetical protein TNCV_2952131 [Trichonephila clavipes]
MSTSAVRLSNESDDFDRRYLRLRMPLRRNRRQDEQLTDFDRGRIIGLREAEGRVYRHGGSGRPRNTNDREIVQSEEWPLRHQQRR